MKLLSFSSTLPNELSGIKLKYSTVKDNVHTKYDTNSVAHGLTISADVYNVWRMINEMPVESERSLFLARNSKGSIIAELQEKNGETQCCIISKHGNSYITKATVVSSDAVSLMKYDTNVRKGTLLLAAIFPDIIADEEAAIFMQDLSPYAKIRESSSWPENIFGVALCNLTSNIYYRVKNCSTLDASGIDEISLTKVTNLKAADTKNVNITEVICGTPRVFNAMSSSQKSVAVKTGCHAIDPKRVLTEAEKTMVPDVGPQYVLSPLFENFAMDIQESTSFEKPFRSICLWGPAGTGKSTGVEALAQMWNLPEVKFGCNPDTSALDITGTFVPNTTKHGNISTSELCAKLGLPTFEDITFDFKGSYQKLFGEDPDSMSTKDDCYSELAKRLMASKSAGGASDFVFVPSAIAQAMKYGWVCEIQEYLAIKRQSVLQVLNSANEDDWRKAILRLPTGEVIHRHPDCVLVFTANRGYSQNDMEQSVYSRCSLKHKVPNPSSEEMAKRVVLETNFPVEVLKQPNGSSKPIITLMVEAMQAIVKHCKDEDISSGVTGPRELSAWAKKVMILKNRAKLPYITEEIIDQAALGTIIDSATQNDEEIQGIIDAYCTVFNPSHMAAAVNAYEVGMA